MSALPGHQMFKKKLTPEVVLDPPDEVPLVVPFPPDVLPPDMVELPELPLPLVELVLPPIEPPVGDDDPVPALPEPEPEPDPEVVVAVALVKPAVMTEVPAVRVPEMDAVEPGDPLAAARAPMKIRKCDSGEMTSLTHCYRKNCRQR